MERVTISMETARTLYALDGSTPQKKRPNSARFYCDNGTSVVLPVKEFILGVSAYSELAKGCFRDAFTLHVRGRNAAVLSPLWTCKGEEYPTSAVSVNTTTQAFVKACQNGPVILTYRRQPFGVLTSCESKPE